jgi:hypothetical protein
METEYFDEVIASFPQSPQGTAALLTFKALRFLYVPPS